MRKMRTLDVCRHGEQTADQAPLNNGQLPHGGYKGSKRYPLSILSFHKGEEFQQNLAQELEQILLEEDTVPQRTTPSWAVLLHRAPSHSDESPLLANKLLTVSKLGQTLETNTLNQNSLQSRTWCKSVRDLGRLYYRPNSTHQFLSATDLRNCAEDQVNINYGRPTRTSLLRTLQRRNSAGANSYHTRRDFLHRLHDLRNSSEANPITEYFKSGKAPDGDGIHSFLTGARYNRYNPALGCCFTEVKADDTLTTRIPKQRAHQTSTYLLRPSTTPGQGSRNAVSWDSPETVADIRETPLKLTVIGNKPSVNKTKDLGFKLPNLQAGMGSPRKHSRRPKDDNFGMYSSRSNSAKADSDIQDISDSVKNAIIASTEETDPGCLETVEKAGPGVGDLERIEADAKEDNVIENLVIGSSENLSSTSLPVVSLPSDIPVSLRQDEDNQVIEENEINLPDVNENEVLINIVDDKDDYHDRGKSDNDFLDKVVDDITDIGKFSCDDDNGILVSSNRNDTSVYSILGDNGSIDSLTGNKQFDQGMPECSGEEDEIIKEVDNDSSEAENGHEENDVATLAKEDETVTFFITEENLGDGENLEAKNLES